LVTWKLAFFQYFTVATSSTGDIPGNGLCSGQGLHDIFSRKPLTAQTCTTRSWGLWTTPQDFYGSNTI